MAIALRSFGSSPGANSTSCVIVKPVGLAVGDFMIAHVMFKNTGAITPPANWNTAGSQVTTLGGRSGVFWKFANGTDAAATNFTFTGGGSVGNRGGMAAYTGVDTTAPIDAASQQANDTEDDTIETPQITTVAANARVLIFGGSDQEGTSSACSGTNPTCAEVWELVTTAGSDCGSHLWDAAKASPGQIDAHTITVSISAASAGHAVSLNPVFTGPFTGTGAVSAQSAATAGTAKLGFVGTAAVVAAAVLLAATGSLGFSGAGALSGVPGRHASNGKQTFSASGPMAGQPAELAGQGSVSEEEPPPITGTGEITAFQAALTGAGQLAFQGSGIFAGTPAAFTGAGLESFAASGGVSSPSAQLVSQATLRFVGIGGIAPWIAGLAGVGTEEFKGVGSFVLPTAELAAAGIVTAPSGFTGTGSISGLAMALASEGSVETLPLPSRKLPRLDAAPRDLPRLDASPRDLE